MSMTESINSTKPRLSIFRGKPVLPPQPIVVARPEPPAPAWRKPQKPKRIFKDSEVRELNRLLRQEPPQLASRIYQRAQDMRDVLSATYPNCFAPRGNPAGTVTIPQAGGAAKRIKRQASIRELLQ